MSSPNKKRNASKRKSPEPRDAGPKDELLHGHNLVFRVALAAVLVFAGSIQKLQLRLLQ